MNRIDATSEGFFVFQFTAKKLFDYFCFVLVRTNFILRIKPYRGNWNFLIEDKSFPWKWKICPTGLINLQTRHQGRIGIDNYTLTRNRKELLMP